MAVFDQRGQHVTYQYNAAGNIDIDSVQNRIELISELEKLKAELSRAASTHVIDAEVVTDADYQISEAIQQAKKPDPDKKTITDHLKEAKALIEGVTAAGGLVTALAQATEMIQKLF